jgi:hypothetical protein
MPLRAEQIRIERAAHYRQKARSLREMAEAAPSDSVSEQLRKVAAEYDQLAERLETSLGAEQP